jgi:hypothetical protein
MCEALFVRCSFHDFFVDMVWAEVAGDAGEQIHVGFSDRFAERDAIADLEPYNFGHRLTLSRVHYLAPFPTYGA